MKKPTMKASIRMHSWIIRTRPLADNLPVNTIMDYNKQSTHFFLSLSLPMCVCVCLSLSLSAYVCVCVSLSLSPTHLKKRLHHPWEEMV